uniref:Uncharacterized protein n=1 Tax=Ciona savignyi TaxID=51511 RepID=H2ZJ82_CIOSA
MRWLVEYFTFIILKCGKENFCTVLFIFTTLNSVILPWWVPKQNLAAKQGLATMLVKLALPKLISTVIN